MDVSSENPFEGLKIQSHEPLHRATGRTRCPECGCSRKYFCYQCHIPMEVIAGKFQTVKLPVKVDIIKHRLEVDGKSTAVHARILAPDDVTIYTYPNIPQYSNKEKLLLVFPHKDAVSLELLMEQRRTSCDERCGDTKERPQNELASHMSKLHLGISEQNAPSSQLEPKRSGTTLLSSQMAGEFETSCGLCEENEDSPSLVMTPSKPSADETNHSPAQTLVDPGKDPKGLVHLAVSDQDNTSQRFHQKCENPTTEHLGRTVETERDEASCRQPGGSNREGSKEWLFERVIFIDCTWNQTSVFKKDERLAGIKSVILEDRKTTFWRSQYRKPDTYLATIEAIYYFMVDFHKIVLKEVYEGQYDNLLFFYSFMYHLVQMTAKEREQKLGKR